MRRVDLLARLGGLILLGSLFLPWYRIYEGIITIEIEGAPSPPPPTPRSWLESAWESLALLDFVLAVLAVLIVAVPRLRTYAAWAAVVIVATRLIEPPDYGDAGRSWGGFVGLAGALLAAWPARRPRLSETLAGVAGLALLLALALPWYGSTVGSLYPGGDTRYADVRIDHTAWQQLAVIDVIVASIAVLALLVALRGTASAALLKAVGWVAIVLVAARIVFAPDLYTTTYGAFVALAAAAIAWGAAWPAGKQAPDALA